ncbi:MAG: FMN-binding protein, partial [Planctomycetes bacterium]|nr:FMN-binding protein [Planctomycetota bacterium]
RGSHTDPPFCGLKALASLYGDYGVFEEGENRLKRGLLTPPPKAVWKEVRQAEFHDALGDLYTRWGKLDQAKASYREAVRIYPLGRPPYGGHLLPRKAKKVEGKLRVLALQSLEGASLRDGTYRDNAEGYSGKVNLTVKIDSGRIADIHVQHQEKIDQNACVIIPKRIVQKQSLQVDGVTGATVTKDAIIAGTLQALQKAGLK